MKTPERKILIVGGGKIGKKALDFCKKNGFTSIIIDDDPKCLVHSKVNLVEFHKKFSIIDEIEGDKSILYVMDLNEMLDLLKQVEFEYTIPAMPMHIVARIALDYLRHKSLEIHPSTQLIELVKERMDPHLICNFSAEDGIIVASFMPQDKKCAKNCTESMTCPVTGFEKPAPLFQIFEDASKEFHARIIISEQLAPGLGGISRQSMRELFNALDSIKDHIILGTSCMCHGIIQAFKVMT